MQPREAHFVVCNQLNILQPPTLRQKAFAEIVIGRP